MLSYKQFQLILVESFKDAETLWVKQGHDADDIKTTIDLFKDLSKKNQITGKERDIGYWMKKPFSDLTRFVNETELKYQKAIPLKKKSNDADAPIIFESDEVIVRRILSKAASCKYGSDSDWCITKEGQTHYESYVAKGIAFYFIEYKLEAPKDEKHNIQRVAVAVYPPRVNEIEFFDRDDSSFDKKMFEYYNDKYFDNIPMETFQPKEGDVFSKMLAKDGLTNELEKALQEVSPFSGKLEFKGDKVIIEKFKNLLDFIEDAGNDDAQYAARIYSGEEHLEYYDGISEGDKEHVYDNYLDDGKVKRYLEDKFGKETIEDYEETLYEFIKEEDEELFDAFSSATYRAMESGTSNEIIKYLTRAMLDIGIKTGDRYDDDDYGSCYVVGKLHDEPFLLGMNIKEFCKLMDDAAPLFEEEGYKYAVEVKAPYYGWQGFDDLDVAYSLVDDGYKELLLDKWLTKMENNK